MPCVDTPSARALSWSMCYAQRRRALPPIDVDIQRVRVSAHDVGNLIGDALELLNIGAD